MSIDEKEYKWYIVHTQSGYENKVRERILKRALESGISNLIVDVFLPAETVREINKLGKRVSKEKFSYPGYILVKMVMNDVTQSIVRRTPGVAGFIGYHATTKEESRIIPSPLSEADVALIFADKNSAEKTDLSNELMRMEFEVGEKVQVIDGPFNGLNGVIESINADKGKLTVNIEIFGRSTPTELDFLKVKKFI